MEERYFINRHSVKPNKDNPESQEYKGLSEKGVEEARRQGRVKDSEMIKNAPEGAVIFLGGATEAVRTVSTAQLRGEGIKEAFAEDEGVVVLTKDEIEDIVKKEAKSVSGGVEKIARLINENKGKKIVIDFPMFIKELSLGKRWGFFSPEGTVYLDYLLDKYEGDEDKVFADWIENRGKTDNPDVQGPDPNDVANEYLSGLRRLRDFAKRYVQERPLVIGGNTHSWEVDVFVVKLAKGEVTPENFQEVSGGGLSKENEGAYLEIDGDKVMIMYRGKTYEKDLVEEKEQ